MSEARRQTPAVPLPNAHLVGQQGSARALNTPALVLDLDVFERNLKKMADHCAKAGLGLRPHSKTHKSVEIAKRQMAAGAVGICCAKLGEAEVMGAGGLDEILLTSPVVKADAIRRLIELNGRIGGLMITVDNMKNAEAIAHAAEAAGKPVRTLVDLDPDLHRTGIAPGEEAAKLAEFVAASPGLKFMGLQTYAGQCMHIHDFAERREKSLAALTMLRGMRDMLLERNISCEVLTGGGTGTFDIDPEAGILTDLQAGSYLFMDTEYNAIGQQGDGQPFETSLMIQTTVVSANTKRMATTDAGIKSMATDQKDIRIAKGAPEGTHYFLYGDEQGGLFLPDDETKLDIDSVLYLETPHCDPTVNLYDVYHVVKDGTLVDLWPVDARGRSA